MRLSEKISNMEAEISDLQTMTLDEEGKRKLKNLKRRLARAKARFENDGDVEVPDADPADTESADNTPNFAEETEGENENSEPAEESQEEDTPPPTHTEDQSPTAGIATDQSPTAGIATDVSNTFTRVLAKGINAQHWGVDTDVKEAIQRLRDTGWKRRNGRRVAYLGSADLRCENGVVKGTHFVCIGEI